MKKIQEIDIKEFVNKFNKEYKSKIPNETTAFLVDLYENFISLNSDGTQENKYLKKVIAVEDKITPTLNEEQEKLFKEYTNANDDMWGNTVEEAFVYGYCVSELLNKISNTIKN